MREIDLSEVLHILLRRVWVIILTALAAGAAALAITHYLITPLYTASIKLYVNNTSETKYDITSSDVSASQSLVRTYITIIKSNTVINKVIEKTGADYSPGQLRGFLSAGALDNTEVLQVSITMPDPEQAYRIANAIADTAPDVLADIVSGSSVRIVDRAYLPQTPSSPNYMRNIVIGLAVGFILSCAILIATALLDTRIKTEADLNMISPLPVLGAITEFGSANNAGYGYGYGSSSGRQRRVSK